MAKNKRQLRIVDLPFISILDERPARGQFVLIAWDINGWCGYTSGYWSLDDATCKAAVAWFPLPNNHVFTRKCALVLRKKHKIKATILTWSRHFSTIIDNYYISTEKLPKQVDDL